MNLLTVQEHIEWRMRVWQITICDNSMKIKIKIIYKQMI